MMANFLSVPRQRALILGVVATRGPMSGAQIAKATGLWSGHLYALLVDLDGDWLASDWERGLSADPRQRLYRSALIQPTRSTPADAVKDSSREVR